MNNCKPTAHRVIYRTFFRLLILIFACFIVTSCDSGPPTQVENGDNGTGNGTEPYSHTRNPGASAEDFLRDDQFTELLIEIQYMPGHRPLDSSLDELKVFLENHLNKITITILEPEEIPSGEKDQYAADEVRDLEEQHRQHFTEGTTLTSYNIFVDGEFSQQNVLGIAYYNTSTAYFGETIQSVSGSPPLNPSREKIESTVLRHEYGHLLGLVNNGTDMEDDHHDVENGAHCTEQECLMYATVQTADFFQNTFDNTIPDLDDFCRADLEAAKE